MEKNKLYDVTTDEISFVDKGANKKKFILYKRQAPGAGDRRAGNPRTDVERVMRHYNCSKDEAERKLKSKSVKDLLPTRGTGLNKEDSKMTDQEKLKKLLKSLEGDEDENAENENSDVEDSDSENKDEDGDGDGDNDSDDNEDKDEDSEDKEDKEDEEDKDEKDEDEDKDDEDDEDSEDGDKDVDKSNKSILKSIVAILGKLVGKKTMKKKKVTKKDAETERLEKLEEAIKLLSKIVNGKGDTVSKKDSDLISKIRKAKDGKELLETVLSIRKGKEKKKIEKKNGDKDVADKLGKVLEKFEKRLDKVELESKGVKGQEGAVSKKEGNWKGTFL